MEHFRPHAIHHSECHFRAVLRRVDVHSERSLAEGRVHDLGDRVTHSRRVGVGRDDSSERLENLVAVPGIGKGIPVTGTENYGGPVVTAGGLIFIGATDDNMFRAFDKDTGKVLWQTRLPFAGMRRRACTWRTASSMSSFPPVVANGDGPPAGVSLRSPCRIESVAWLVRRGLR